MSSNSTDPHSDYQSALNWVKHQHRHSNNVSSNDPQGVNWFWVIIILAILIIGVWWWVSHSNDPKQPETIETSQLNKDPHPEKRLEDMKRTSEHGSSRLAVNSPVTIRNN